MTETQLKPPSRAMVWTGRAISALIVLLMGAGSVFSLLNLAQTKEQMRTQGYPPESVVWLIIVQMACVLLYAIPRTAVLGAVLLTGYFGGAVATHVIRSEWTYVFALIAGVLAWLGLYFRDARVRALVPLRKL